MKTTIQRVTFSPDTPTYGMMLIHGLPMCLTLERPWRDNAHDVSCIPAGTYKMKKFHSPSKGLVFLIEGVPNRTMIEVHCANSVGEIQGCIAVGLETAGSSILKSREALDHLLLVLPDECDLEIVNPQP